jgi:hypothetical protein
LRWKNRRKLKNKLLWNLVTKWLLRKLLKRRRKKEEEKVK